MNLTMIDLTIKLVLLIGVFGINANAKANYINKNIIKRHDPIISFLRDFKINQRIYQNLNLNYQPGRDILSASIDFNASQSLQSDENTEEYLDYTADDVNNARPEFKLKIQPFVDKKSVLKDLNRKSDESALILNTTNYSLYSRNSGNFSENRNRSKRKNFTETAVVNRGNSRLQGEGNVINQSDVLHLDAKLHNNDDDGGDNEQDEDETDIKVLGTNEVNMETNSSGKAQPADNGEDNLSMAWWVQLSWTGVFVLMILIAIGGNCIVMWIVIGHKRMRSVTNYFLVNLSCADLLLSTLNCFFNFIYMLQGNWQFGGWYCTVNNFIANTTVAASVFTLTAMCCDRHFAIVHPLHPRMSKVTAIVVIILIWCLSMVLASPCLFFSTTITYRSKHIERTACILIWPDGQPTDSQMDFGYQVLFLIITYIVPMTLMSFFYTSIGKVLWGSQSIGETTQMQLDAIRSKRKVVKMIVFIVLLFAICWLPYHAYFIYTHFDRSILYTRYVQHVYLAFYWFAMANAMVNPLIYYWMNAKFRGYFRRAICCWRPRDPEFDANLNGRTFKSTRCDDEETRISLRLLKHSNTTMSTTTGSKSRSIR